MCIQEPEVDRRGRLRQAHAAHPTGDVPPLRHTRPKLVPWQAPLIPLLISTALPLPSFSLPLTSPALLALRPMFDLAFAAVVLAFFNVQVAAQNGVWGGINITQQVLCVAGAISQPTCNATSYCVEFVTQQVSYFSALSSMRGVSGRTAHDDGSRQLHGWHGRKHSSECDWGWVPCAIPQSTRQGDCHRRVAWSVHRANHASSVSQLCLPSPVLQYLVSCLIFAGCQQPTATTTSATRIFDHTGTAVTLPPRSSRAGGKTPLRPAVGIGHA